jgi:hypothetical protein
MLQIEGSTGLTTGRGIGRGIPITYTPLPPNVTPLLDFYMWGCLKGKVLFFWPRKFGTAMFHRERCGRIELGSFVNVS